MKCKLMEDNSKQQVCGDMRCLPLNLGVNQVQFVVMYILSLIMNWPEISNMKFYFNLHVCNLRGGLIKSSHGFVCQIS